MHRFYLPSENCQGISLRLDGREAHHALHVLRLKSGDAVTVLDGVGNEYSCTVAVAGKDALTLTLKEKQSSAPLPCDITLCVAVPKGKLIEDIIEKAVELGVRRVVPLLTQRVISQLDQEAAESKRQKWQQVAVEAIKQCGAAWLPLVSRPQKISEFLAANAQSELGLIGSLQTERRHPREWIAEFQRQQGRLPKNVTVWIGPEGDFTLAELETIIAAGAKPITLGALTLRVETAAIYCLSFLNYELQA